jgi:hypothetical protein
MSVIVWRPGQGPSPDVGNGIWRDIGIFWFDHRMYGLDACETHICVSYWSRRTMTLIWSAYVPIVSFGRKPNYGEYTMAVKYITSAIKKAEKRKCVSSTNDPVIYGGRPAIWEFMHSLVGAEDSSRKPSSLMVCACEAGVRVGLCDDDADGWVWREAPSLAEALDAIEKALASGKVQWSQRGGYKRRAK